MLGRTQDNGIVVNDVKASSHHAELRFTGQDYTITDIGSTNGTYVNDQQIDRNLPRVLRSGDRIRIGDTSYTFEVRGAQQPGMYGAQGSNPNFAPTQLAQPQYPGTAYGGSSAQNFAPTQPAADFQQGGFGQYPGSNFTPPPQPGSSFNHYNQQAPASPYSVPPPPQYNLGQQYGPVPGTYPAPGTNVPYGAPPTPPKRGGGLRTILLAGLALIVILGALATFFVVRNSQIAAANASATATVSTRSTATARTAATAVAVAQATGTAIVNATATAGAGGTARDGAYATGNVALDDPMKDNSGGHKWEESSFCSFNQQVYEVKETHANTFVTCFAQATNYSNFSYRVLMTIANGDCSGLAFRGDPNTNKQYYVEICPSAGTYALLLYDGTNDKYLIRPTVSSSIKTGDKVNIIAVTANNDTFQLYANATLLNTAQDATLTSGSIGVVTINHNSSGTDAFFGYSKVWTA